MPEEVLSQDAIDAMLRQMSGGSGAAAPATATPESQPHTARTSTTPRTTAAAKTVLDVQNHRKIRDYDFRRPNRISKDHMRALRLIHETFTREVPRIWGPMLRAGGQVKITSMEQTIYEEFRNHLSPHCFIATVAMQPLEGEIVFQIELDAAYVIIDRLLGGPGTGLKRSREFTTLELSILQRIVTALMPAWREAWINIIHTEPGVNRVLASTEFLQLTALNESVLVTSLQARFLNTDIELSICIPYAVIAPIMTRIINTEQTHQHGGSNIEDREKLLRHLAHTQVDVAARLGHAPIPVAALKDLAIGDIIRLDTPVNGAGVMTVAGSPHFVIRPGLANGGLAVQITDIVRNFDPLTITRS